MPSSGDRATLERRASASDRKHKGRTGNVCQQQKNRPHPEMSVHSDANSCPMLQYLRIAYYQTADKVATHKSVTSDNPQAPDHKSTIANA
jgi:hypothetical protein